MYTWYSSPYNCNPSEQEWLCLATVQIAVILLMGVAMAKMNSHGLLLSDTLPCIDHLDVPATSFEDERAGQVEEGGFSIRLIKHGHV